MDVLEYFSNKFLKSNDSLTQDVATITDIKETELQNNKREILLRKGKENQGARTDLLPPNKSDTLTTKCNEYDTLKEKSHTLHTIKTNEYDDYKKKSDESDTIKRNQNTTSTKFNLDGIEFGANWFELHYSDNSINYIKHSTKDNLMDYFNRLQMNNNSINKPIRIKPIAIDGIRIVYLN